MNNKANNKPIILLYKIYKISQMIKKTILKKITDSISLTNKN